jgi:hypothetical protein
MPHCNRVTYPLSSAIFLGTTLGSGGQWPTGGVKPGSVTGLRDVIAGLLCDRLLMLRKEC